MDCEKPKDPKFCDDGQYPNENSIGCRYCEKGSYCVQGLIENCPPGNHCPNIGMHKPTPCPAGKYCEGGPQLEPKACPEKKYSEKGWYKCQSCPAAFYCDGGIKKSCPKGRD